MAKKTNVQSAKKIHRMAVAIIIIVLLLLVFFVLTNKTAIAPSDGIFQFNRAKQSGQTNGMDNKRDAEIIQEIDEDLELLEAEYNFSDAAQYDILDIPQFERELMQNP